MVWVCVCFVYLLPPSLTLIGLTYVCVSLCVFERVCVRVCVSFDYHPQLERVGLDSDTCVYVCVCICAYACACA